MKKIVENSASNQIGQIKQSINVNIITDKQTL